MKLVFAIVHTEDSLVLMDHLNEEGFPVTKLASTGGFLHRGITTLFIVTENEKVQMVVDIVKQECRTRTQEIDTPITTGIGGVFSSFPTEVEAGGATIFVVDVERFEKV